MCVLEEFKKVNIILSLFELMKVPRIGETMISSLSDSATTKTNNQNASSTSRGMANASHVNMNVVQEEIDANQQTVEAKFMV